MSRAGGLPPRPAEVGMVLRMRAGLAIPLAIALSGCVYFNTFYNAKKYYGDAEKLAAKGAEEQGLPASARAAYERSVEKSSRVLADHPHSKYADDALLLLGMAYYRLGEFSQSSAALRSLLESYPESDLRREATLWLVRAGREGGDTEAAEGLAEELLAEGKLSSSDRVVLQMERARLAQQGGDAAGAIAIYEELLRTDADRARGVPLLLARAELAAGDTATALVELRSLVASPQIGREASVLVGEVLASTGQREQAIETYRQILTQDVGDSLAAQVRLALAEARHGTGDAAGAAEELATAARLVPSTPVASKALYHRGLLQWRALGARDEAKKTFLEAFLEDPDAPVADSAAQAARAIQEIQHYQAILSGSERVLSPLPPDEVRATATYLLAELLFTREDDIQGARRLFEEVLERTPSSAWVPKVLYTLGWLAEDAARASADSAAAPGTHTGPVPEQAAAFYRRLIAEHPETEYAEYARERFADAEGVPTGSLESPLLVVAPAVPLDSSGGVAPAPALDPAVRTAAPGLLPLPEEGQVVEIPSGGVAAPGESSDTRALARASPDSAATPPSGGPVRERVDDKLAAMALALPAAQDPLLGIEDRLLARRRDELDDRARPLATPGQRAQAEAAAERADSLTPGQTDAMARGDTLGGGADSLDFTRPLAPAAPLAPASPPAPAPPGGTGTGEPAPGGTSR